MRRRRVCSYIPHDDRGLLVCDDQARTRASFARTLGSDRGFTAMQSLSAITERLAGPAFASLTEPLLSRDAFAALVADPVAWTARFQRPLGTLLQTSFADDLVRGIVATDALIGTFAAMDCPDLRQNRCFLYHVIGNGTGRWDVLLSPQLRAAGAQTLTVFGLHMPARLFTDDHPAAKTRAVSATLASLDEVLAEPIADCLWPDSDGEPCLEARTPLELESELALPAGHIFHRDLAWPFAEHDGEVGSWGVETARPNVWICGAGARRGGGVSGIAGHNAARAVLAADAA